GVLPAIYNDNSAVVAGGVQSLIPGIDANVYAEAGNAISLLKVPVTGRSVPDYRAGMNWFHQWGTSMTQMAISNPSSFSLISTAYGDASFYSRYDNNVIGYVQLRGGVNMPTGRFLPMQILGAVNFIKDTNRDFYNNVAEAGPAIRIAPGRR